MHPLEDVHPLGPLRGERRLGRRNDARIAGRAEFALRIGLVSLLDGRFRVVTNHPTGAEDEISMADLTEAEVWDAIQASAAIPFVFPPVWIRGHIYVDGGVRNVTPLTHAFRERPHEIRAIFTAPQGRRIPVKDEGTFRDDALGIRVSALHILARAIEILTDEIYVEDVDGARLWNAILGAWNALARRLPPEVRATEPYRRLRALVGRKRRAALYEYYPEVFYGRRNAATEFRPQAIRRYYEHGLEIARAHPRGNGPSLP